MEPIDIEKALAKDENIQAGIDEFDKISTKANSIAEEITSAIVDTIVKDSENFNITTAMLAVSKCLGQLASFLYDNEESFLADFKKARGTIVSDVIPALLDPKPCGKCESCKNGNPSECINPTVRGDYTKSCFLPLVCQMLIEYDLYNKILYMHINKNNIEDEPVKEVVDNGNES